MPGDLSDADLKFQRAKHHLGELKKSIKTRVDADLYRFELRRDSQSGKHVLTAHNVPTVDPQWRLQIGEILFNL